VDNFVLVFVAVAAGEVVGVAHFWLLRVAFLLGCFVGKGFELLGCSSVLSGVVSVLVETLNIFCLRHRCRIKDPLAANHGEYRRHIDAKQNVCLARSPSIVHALHQVCRLMQRKEDNDMLC
jgi:hypothetical protein